MENLRQNLYIYIILSRQSPYGYRALWPHAKGKRKQIKENKTEQKSKTKKTNEQNENIITKVKS